VDALTHGVDYNLAFGEPSLIRNALPHLPTLRWVQTSWAGVEPLLEPSLRSDYVLTNTRGVFGLLMSDTSLGTLYAT
jgi:phosphoglycerate dehydrogenase-like enzyme